MNDAAKFDISEIDIIYHYCKYSNRTLIVKVTELHGIGYYAIKAEYVHIEYSYTLELYMIESCTGVKSSRKLQFSVEVNR